MKSLKQRNLGNLLLAVVIVTVVVAPTAMIFRWTVDGGYAPWRNYVSDLSAGPVGSNTAFIVMILSFALLLGAFFAVSPKLLRARYDAEPSIHVGSFIGIACSVDFVIMALYPLDLSRPDVYRIHIICGIVLFVCMAGFLSVYGLVLRDKTGLLRIGSYFGLISALLCLVFAVLLFLVEVTGTLNQSAIVYLIQWSAFFTFNLWALFTGVQLRRDDT
jgi:hypothetical protein